MFLKAPKFWYEKSSTNVVLQKVLHPFCSAYRYFAVKNLRKGYTYRAHKARTIAVGGITVGGSGKTPVVASMCEIAANAGIKSAVLSRGFARKSDKVLKVDSEIHTFKDVGDEPLMLTKYSDVFVSKNRMVSAELAENSNHNLLILDDGLTQRDLHPDIKIVVVDSTQGFGNGELLPLGPNRLDFSMFKPGEIDAVVVLKASENEDVSDIIKRIPENLKVIFGYLQGDFSLLKLQDLNHTDWPSQKDPKKSGRFKNKGKKSVVLEAVTAVSDLDSSSEIDQSNPSDLRQIKFLAFCGIGYPQKFFNFLRKELHVLSCIEFPDHYPFTDDDITDLLDEARLLDARLVTTEKDLCRIPKQYHNFISVVPVKVVWDNPAEIARFLELNGIDSN